jgi:hypothetical protein
MAVEHLQTRARPVAPSPAQVIRKYTEGFSHCIQEVNRCMALTPEAAKPQIHQRLMHHLSSYLLSVPQKILATQTHLSAQRNLDLEHRSAEQSVSGSGAAAPLRVPAYHPHMAVDVNNNFPQAQNLNQIRSHSAPGSSVPAPGSFTPGSAPGSRQATPTLPPANRVPDHFFNPIRVQVEGLEALTPVSDFDSSEASTTPVSRRSEDVMEHQQHGNIMSVKQAWIEQVHEARKKAVSDDVWRPW